MSPLESRNGRAPSLDMLRGFAALIVVLAHTSVAGVYKVEPLWSHLKWTPLRVVWAGHQAVILFFMLSGFALAHMYGEARTGRYKSFAAARVIRLYPPYIASLAVAAAGYWLLGHAGFTWDKGWMNTARPTIDAKMIVDHLLMVGSYDTTPINPPMWSIVHEMRISLAFPLVAVLVDRLDARAVLLALGTSVAIGCAALAGSPTRIPWSAQDALLTLHYTTFFVIGSWFYRHRETIARWAMGLARIQRALLSGLALLLFSYPFDNPWSIGGRIFGDLGVSAGAFLLMALSFALDRGPVFALRHWLGKISYSLYLNHYVVMSAMMIVVYPRFGSMPVWVLTVAGAVTLAVAMHRLVEAPTQKLARIVRGLLAGGVRRPALR